MRFKFSDEAVAVGPAVPSAVAAYPTVHRRAESAAAGVVACRKRQRENTRR